MEKLKPNKIADNDVITYIKIRREEIPVVKGDFIRVFKTGEIIFFPSVVLNGIMDINYSRFRIKRYNSKLSKKEFERVTKTCDTKFEVNKAPNGDLLNDYIFVIR